MYKCVIIDDEPLAVGLLESIIRENCADLEISGFAMSALEGIKLIRKTCPDIVFLDIEMPGGSGFDVLECFNERPFEIIFVTAYNQYAIKAFKFNALDYLLKPLDTAELITAVEKAKKSIDEHVERHKQYLSVAGNFQTGNIKNLAVPTSNGLEYIELCNISWIEGDRGYSTIYLTGSKKIVVCKSLGEFDDILKDYFFVRIHKSYIINLYQIEKYIKAEGGAVQLKNGVKLMVSRRSRENLLKALKLISKDLSH
ncbi:MAG: response regulator transcription factor [Bacteroidia bacterium]|nr:response regulator transcription factor [Bacteroidia bacterium]